MRIAKRSFHDTIKIRHAILGALQWNQGVQNESDASSLKSFDDAANIVSRFISRDPL